MTDEPRARRTDPDTSHLAAASVRSLTENQAAVYRVLLLGPMNDEEIAAAYENVRQSWQLPLQAPSGLRTRRDDLRKAGLIGVIVPTPDRPDTGSERTWPDGKYGPCVQRIMTTGRWGIVWQVLHADQ